MNKEIKFLLITLFISLLSLIFTSLNYLLILAFSSSYILSYILFKFCIKYFNRLKFKQVIRLDGPIKHLKKSGTPSMGGLIFIIFSIICSLLININKLDDKPFLAVIIITSLFMFIGLADDLKSIKSNRSKGLSSIEKIIFQFISCLIFIYYLFINSLINSEISLWNNLIFDFNILIYPIIIFALIAQSNSINLTDGIDGLASGCSAIIFFGLSFLITFNSENNNSLAIFCVVMAGALIGFFIHNKYPAKIFMGDTGSLPLGAAMAGIAILTDNLWPLLIMSIIPVLESLSVIIQVNFFKISKIFNQKGKRIFLMAPIHHHFELKGYSEKFIVLWSLIITAVFTYMSLLLTF